MSRKKQLFCAIPHRSACFGEVSDNLDTAAEEVESYLLGL